MSALSHLRVLDLTRELGALCGRILADLGADVVKVEPPGGHRLRARRPFAEGVADPERSLAWWAYAAGCRSLVLDLERAGDRARLLGLARHADVVFESFAPGHLERLDLGWDTLHRENPRLILTSITPFGVTGPHRGRLGPELVLQAASGAMHNLGDRDRPPVRMGGAQAELQAGGQAVAGTLVAYHERERTGRGQWVDVSAQAAMIWTMLSETALPPLHRYTPERDGIYTRAARFRRRLIFPCRDGFVALTVTGGVLGAAMMQAMTAWMQEEGAAPDFMVGRDWLKWDTTYLYSLGDTAQAEIDRVTEAVAAFVAPKSKAELYETALARSLLIAPLSDTSDLVKDVQLAAREFFVPAAEPRLGRDVVVPGPFARLSGTPITPPRPAPRLGEGGHRVLDAWRMAASDNARVVAGAGAPHVVERESPLPSTASISDPREPRTPAPPVREDRRGDPGRVAQAFDGLRVIDFAWVATGPITGRLLAEFGADVIRVESSLRVDPGRTLPPWADGKAGYNRSQLFANANAGKRSVALDLNRPPARDLARRLVATADVVIESFTPGTMARWGLDYESVRTVRPGIVYLSSCQQGQTGPHAHYRGYGSLAAALAGFYTVTGWPDRPPAMIYGAYTDFVAHHFASAALLAALDHRRRTGEGQHIDVSQLESSLHFLAPEILDYTVNGRIAERRGNSSPEMAPHAAYPCAGDDRWCVIACETDAQWRQLANLIAEPWARAARYQTVAGRKDQEPELDASIAGWTGHQEAYALVDALQAADVPAGVVQSCADLHGDVQLAARDALVWLEHPEMGRTPYEAWAFRFAGRHGAPRRAPCLGEHTRVVLSELLGLSVDEIHALERDGILA